MRKATYRWEENEINENYLLDAVRSGRFAPKMFVSDNPHTWASPHMKDMRLLKINVEIKRPLINNNIKTSISKRNAIQYAIKNGYDAIVSEPPSPLYEREIILLYPKKQIKSVSRVKK